VCLFCVFFFFFENDKTDLRQIFLGFRRKDLLITTCMVALAFKLLKQFTEFVIILKSFLLSTIFKTNF